MYRSTYRISFAPDFKQCVRVSSYITTQWDKDNKTPITEEITVFKGPLHEEFIDHSSWNGRQPILDGDYPCVICEDAQSKYCSKSDGLVDQLKSVIASNRDAAPKMDAPIRGMKSAGMDARLINAVVKQKGLMLETADVAEEVASSVQKRRAEWCD